MYFDAVLDERMNPIFNGTPEETKKWLSENRNNPDVAQVCDGRNMRLVSIDDYLL